MRHASPSLARPPMLEHGVSKLAASEGERQLVGREQVENHGPFVHEEPFIHTPPDVNDGLNVLALVSLGTALVCTGCGWCRDIGRRHMLEAAEQALSAMWLDGAYLLDGAHLLDR